MIPEGIYVRRWPLSILQSFANWTILSYIYGKKTWNTPKRGIIPIDRRGDVMRHKTIFLLFIVLVVFIDTRAQGCPPVSPDLLSANSGFQFIFLGKFIRTDTVDDWVQGTGIIPVLTQFAGYKFKIESILRCGGYNLCDSISVISDDTVPKGYLTADSSYLVIAGFGGPQTAPHTNHCDIVNESDASSQGLLSWGGGRCGGTTTGPWVRIGQSCEQGTGWISLGVSGPNLFAGFQMWSNGHAIDPRFGISVYADSGTSCKDVDSGQSLGVPFSFGTSGGFVYTATNTGVYQTSNNGASWNWVLETTACRAIAISNNSIFIGTYGSGVFHSTNDGASWTPVNNGLPDSSAVTALAVSGTNVLAGTVSGLFFSTNSGASWTEEENGLTYSPGSDTGISALIVLPFAGNSFYGLAATKNFSGSVNLQRTYTGGLFLLTFNGASVTATAVNSALPNNAYITSFVKTDSTVFAGTLGGGVIGSKNNFASWTAFNDNLTNLSVTALAVDNGYLFAGTVGSGVWRRPLSEMLAVLPQKQHTLPLQTGIHSVVSGSLGSGIRLNYSVQSNCAVTLSIFTMSGKQVASFDDGVREPGTYAVNLGRGRIPAGIYVCRFEAGRYQESSRIVVTK